MEIIVYSLGPFVAVFLILLAFGGFSGEPAERTQRPATAAFVLTLAVGVAAGLLGLLISRAV